MMDINRFIDEMTNDILNQKRALDMPIFLNFLKEELENAGITLTIKRQQTPMIGNHIVASDIVGIQLDLTEHDKKKNVEIEKYKKAFESAKCERDKVVCDYQTEINRLKSRIGELEESQEELPFEPICIAEYLMNRTIEVKNTFPALQGGETSHVPVHDVSELRQIAEHLLVYCKYHSEE